MHKMHELTDGEISFYTSHKSDERGAWRMEKCPACTTTRNHTDTFDKLYATIFNELRKRELPGVDDPEELAKTLSVLVADSLDIDIYE